MPISAQIFNNLFSLFEHFCLLVLRNILISAEVVFDKLDYCSGKQEYTYQVRDGHKSVEFLSDLPDDSKIHRGSEDRYQGVDDQERLRRLASENELGAAGSVKSPAENG